MFLAWLLPPSALADGDWQRTSLKGLQAVHVFATNEGTSGDPDGRVSLSSVQTDVELRLRQSGIRVLSSSDAAKTPTTNGLLKAVVVMLAPKSGEGLYTYSVGVQFLQWVLLPRHLEEPLLAITWSEGGFGTVGSARLSSLRDNVRDQVDKFINAYLAMDPKN